MFMILIVCNKFIEKYILLVCVFFSNLAINDLSNFLLELGGFLREYGCPYKNLIENENRLNNRLSRLQLLDYLCTEIQAAKMNKSFNREIITNGIDHSTNKKVKIVFLF